MKKLIRYVFLVPLCVTLGLHAQVKIKGKVFDQDGNPLPYADIYFKDTKIGTASDINGNFYLQSNKYYPQIEVSFVGFQSKILSIKKGYQNVEVSIQPYTEEQGSVGQVVVSGKKIIKYKSKKENPAYRILRNVWQHRKHNGLKKSHDYQYDKYQKIELDFNNIDSNFTKKKIFNKFHFVFDKIDTSRVFGDTFLPLFFNESISKVYGLNDPEKKREDLMANKASGFENKYALIGTVKSLYTDFNIYDNQIMLFNKPFASPLATNGFNFYEYQLIDSTNIEGKKNYRIKYFPKNKSSLTFSGTAWIADSIWSVTDISLKATEDINVNFVKDIYIEQSYDLLNDSIFVLKSDYALLNLSLISKRKKAKGMYARRTRIFKNYKFNLNKPATFYDIKPDTYKKYVYDKPDEFWDKNRYEKLNRNERGIYETLDSLNKMPRFRNIVNIVEVLSTGYIDTGKIQYGSIYNTIGRSDIEGIRIRGGFRTFWGINDRARLRGYLAYGTKDKQFKYGIEAKYLVNKSRRWTIGLGNKRDIEQLGSQLVSNEGILTRSFGSSSILSSGGNTQLSNLNRTNIFTSFELALNAKLRFDATYQTIKSASSLFNADFFLKPEPSHTGETQGKLIDSRIAVSFSAQPGRRFSGSGVERFDFDRFTIYPTFILKYTKGLKGVINSGFDYDKIEFLYNQPILLSTLGIFQTTFSFGKTIGNVPLSLLNIIPANESYGYVSNTFGLMNYYEFVTDRYAMLQFEHHLGGRLFNKIPLIKKLKLREVFFFRGAWGKLSTDNLNMIVDDKLRERVKKYGFKQSTPYYEYGFGIENIGLGNLRFFRIDFNWRGNYLDNPKAKRFGIKIGMETKF